MLSVHMTTASKTSGSSTLKQGNTLAENVSTEPPSEGQLRNKTIREVVKLGLCTGCGTCVGVCPKSAIKLITDTTRGVYLPQIDKKRCNECGICYKVCPGHSVGFRPTNSEETAQKRITQSSNILIGNYDNCYIGYSSSQNIRHNATSGGLVTQLLAFLLEEGIIDGALVTTIKKGRPLEPEPFIARTKEEIISASKSKYCPVPANISLEVIRRQEGRFAVVGLPCHIQGIRKAEAFNKRLKDKIFLHLGLLCSHTINFIGTEVLLEKMGIKKQEVRQLNYRGDGWPGRLSAVSQKGQQISMRYGDYWNSLFGPFFFTPLRCLSCYDHTNESADLSFGDAWLKDTISKDEEGSSIIISRTEVGDEILKRAESAGMICLNKIDVKEIVKSQYTSLYSKKFGAANRIGILNLFGVRTPTYSNVKRKWNPLLSLTCLLQVLDAISSQRKSVHFFLKHTPFMCLRAWGAFLYYLGFLSYKLQEGVEHIHARS